MHLLLTMFPGNAFARVDALVCQWWCAFLFSMKVFYCQAKKDKSQTSSRVFNLLKTNHLLNSYLRLLSQSLDSFHRLLQLHCLQTDNWKRLKRTNLLIILFTASEQTYIQSVTHVFQDYSYWTFSSIGNSFKFWGAYKDPQ